MKYYTYKKNVPLKPGEKIGFKRGKGYYVIPAPPAPHPPVSPFSGVGVFTAWDSAAALGLKADWCALQLDPEGNWTASPADLRAAGYKRVFGWQARPDAVGVQRCVAHELDAYIGQAENQGEYDACMTLDVGMPHALVGNCGDWWNTPQVKAKGWELIIEAYDCEQEGLHNRLDSKGYPVASYLYGCYAGAVGRVSLAQYRIWYPGSSWSVYLAETLTPEDRGLFA